MRFIDFKYRNFSFIQTVGLRIDHIEADTTGDELIHTLHGDFTTPYLSSLKVLLAAMLLLIKHAANNDFGAVRSIPRSVSESTRV